MQANPGCGHEAKEYMYKCMLTKFIDAVWLEIHVLKHTRLIVDEAVYSYCNHGYNVGIVVSAAIC